MSGIHVSNALKTMSSTLAFEVTQLYFDVLGCKIMFINDFASLNSNNDNTLLLISILVYYPYLLTKL
jgi:hypothetical protein